jgi:hypothetical protein
MPRKHKQSSSDGKNPYQQSSKIHRFWNSPMYSQESKQYFEERANAFIMEEMNSKKVNWIKR